MAHPSLPRSLWNDSAGRKEIIKQADLIGRAEPLVVLGEPGMGKTELLRWLGGQPGYVYCTARKLINVRPGPRVLLGSASVLVIDALDELSVKAEGDAVDAVLQKLGDADYPRFVLACRVADWRYATGAAAIAEQYSDARPTVLHLEPLTDHEVHQLLVAELEGDTGRADAVIEHFENVGLGGLLSNPQTLELVTRVARAGPLPATKALLFENAVALLRKEQNSSKVRLQPDETSALDAAGAAFAALILTGSEALVVDSADPIDGELSCIEVAALPDASKLGAILGSRLFGTAGAPNRFSYWHRSIGEYLGARWLAGQATSSLKRRRLLSLFHAHEIVPTSLRGLHAWLAHHSSSLAPAVIEADPIGVVDYGYADTLNPIQAQLLLDALKSLAARNPNFVLGHRPMAKALVQPALLEAIRALIRDRSTAFFLQYLIVTNVKGAPIAEALREDLRSMLNDPLVAFSIRKFAFEALAQLGHEDWLQNLESLRRSPMDSEGIRLALEIIQEVGFAVFGERLIIEFVVAASQNEERVVGLLGKMADRVPEDHIDALLDELAGRIVSLPSFKKNTQSLNGTLTDFAYDLILRRLKTSPVDPKQLWQWLKPFDSQFGHERKSQKSVNEHLREATDLRQGIQRWVLLEQATDQQMGSRAYFLSKAAKDLMPNEGDVVALLSALNPSDRTDLRWRQVLQLISHTGDSGGLARETAKRFASHRQDLLNWIDRLAHPPVPKWRVRQAKMARRTAARRAMEYREARMRYRDQIEALRLGSYSEVYGPAIVLLAKASDVERAGEPRERLVAWLGTDLADAAIEGLEAIIQSDSLPTAQQVAKSNAESRYWEASPVIVAALLVRFLDGRGFTGISDDRLLAGFWLKDKVTEHPTAEHFATAVEAEIRARGLMEIAVRSWVEPQLELHRADVYALSGMLRNFLSEDSSAKLCLNWLSQFPDMAGGPEADIVDCLLSFGRQDELRPFLTSRMMQSLTDERRLSWDAVAFLIDFDAHRDRIFNDGSADPSLIWWLRRRIRTDRGPRVAVPLSVSQLECLIEIFRGIYPFVLRPSGGTTGDRNPWDASRFLESIGSRLADSTSQEAVEALTRLVTATEDGYTQHLLGLAAEQRRKRTEEQYKPASLTEVSAIVTSQPPRAVSDLQATVLELLENVQKRIHADPADPWRGFYTDTGTPHQEERCRDHLLTMLGIRPESIDFTPECHMAADKRADILATLNGMHLPIEIKGQWHSDVWNAADTQLDRLYATDYAAEKRGIYIVLWFGHNVPESRKPRAGGRGRRRPMCPDGFRRGLLETSITAREGRVSIVVLNMERAISNDG